MFVAKTVKALMHSLFKVDAFSLRSCLNVIIYAYILKTLFIPGVNKKSHALQGSENLTMFCGSSLVVKLATFANIVHFKV